MTATAHLGTVRRTLPLRWVLHGHVNSILRFAVKVLFAIALAVVVTPVVVVALGYQPSFLHTDAMAPAMATGDILIYETVDPAAIAVGDVVTYSDPERGGVTTRITAVGAGDATVTFVTKADASEVTSPWTVSAQEEITRVAYRIEGAGRAVELPTAAAMGGMALVLIIGVIWGGTSIRSRRAAARYW